MLLIILLANFLTPIKTGAGLIFPINNCYMAFNPNLPNNYKECEDEYKKSVEIFKKNQVKAQEQTEKNRIYEERKSELASYSQFFEELGITLNIETTDYKYQQWLKQLKEKKKIYDKEQGEKRIREEEEERNSQEQEKIQQELKLQEKIKSLVSQELQKRSLIFGKEKSVAQPTPKPKALEESEVKKEDIVQKINNNYQYTKEQINISKNHVSELGIPMEENKEKSTIWKRIISWFRFK